MHSHGQLLYTEGNFRGQADLYEICPHVNGLPERKQWSQTKCLLTKITVFELNEPTKITRYTVLNGGSYSCISLPTPHHTHTHRPSPRLLHSLRPFAWGVVCWEYDDSWVEVVSWNACLMVVSCWPQDWECSSCQWWALVHPPQWVLLSWLHCHSVWWGIQHIVHKCKAL